MKAATKSSLGLLGAVVIAGALGLYAYFGVMKPDEQQAEQKAVDERLIHAGAALPDGGAPDVKFTRLAVTSGGETSVLEQREGEWFLTAPVEARADPEVVRALLRELELGKVKEALEEKPTAEDLARYGLQPPRFSVRATTEGGPAEHVIEGGIENPFDRSIFIRKGGRETVFSAPGTLRDALDKRPFELRDKRVLAIPTELLASLEVKHGKGRYVLTRDQGEWRLTAPIQAKANADEITSLLTALGNERASAFPEETPELRRHFDKPTVDATFTLTSGGSIRIRLGGSGGVLHALREESGRPAVLAQVNPSAATHLTKSAEELRDLKLLSFDREAVARITLDGQSGRVELVKEATDAGPSGAWRVTQPTSGNAKAWKVSSLLWSLSALEGSRLVAESAKGLSAYGLDRPAQQVELFGADGALLAALSIGNAVKGNAQRVFAGNGAGAVYELERSRLNDIPGSASELLEPEVTDAGVAASSPE